MFRVEYLFVFKFDSKIQSGINAVIYNLKGNDSLKFRSDTDFSFNGKNFHLEINGVRKEESATHKSCRLIFSTKDVTADVAGALKFLSFEAEITSTLKQIQHESLKMIENSAAAYLAKESYILINETENQMRKLITLFMTANVGPGWEENNTPENVEDSVKNKEKLKEDTTANLLFYVDFIQLSAFLFKAYQTIDNNELFTKLNKDEISIDQIKERLIPKSNWTRYFHSYMNTSDVYITKRWKELYDLRNSVAHNRNINESEFGDIKNLTGALGKIIDKAIGKVNEIELTESQKEEVSSVVKEEINQSALINLTTDLNNNIDLNSQHIIDGGAVLSTIADGMNLLNSIGIPSQTLSKLNLINKLNLKDHKMIIETNDQGKPTGGFKIISSKDNGK
ncbi:HEPN domain-containing protein [Enterobacter mori]|uniref:HEPN domain-containing protein n=1 Tax=Enterobacter mori TaxID=539813 RepID=UPI000E74BC97|nr:HEPN domain-containing protein [Enterobacter mori]KAA1061538.1 hypothetical protein D5265_011380 [Enterobacter mori]